MNIVNYYKSTYTYIEMHTVLYILTHLATCMLWTFVYFGSNGILNSKRIITARSVKTPSRIFFQIMEKCRLTPSVTAVISLWNALLSGECCQLLLANSNAPSQVLYFLVLYFTSLYLHTGSLLCLTFASHGVIFFVIVLEILIIC